MGSSGVFAGTYLSDNDRWEEASSGVGHRKFPHTSNVGVNVSVTSIVSLCDMNTVCKNTINKG